ncbi:phosphoethanolamine transferase [Pseudoalteromonas fenneropenaei]|uniref:Phosphoethanolamine transferase n=1 Tax=Pseudoalteromonas fenneropenaei TaxID=1737459 RepID=A0ABV7CIS3_9GAMM
MQFQLLRNVLFALLCCAIASVPELLYGMLNSSYIAFKNPKAYLITLVLFTVLSFVKNRVFFVTVTLLVAFIQSGQLMYFHYFGNFSSAFDIKLLFLETYDALTGFWDVAPFLLLPGVMPIISAAAISLLRVQQQDKLRHFGASPVLVILLLCAPFAQSYSSNAFQKFQPNIGHSALKNGLYSMSYFLSLAIRSNNETITDYQPYVVTSVPTSDYNIVILMGESLSTLNMGLYGYERDTTPELNKLKSDSNFFYTRAISSAVTTRVSLAMFYNVTYEPDNAKHLRNMDTALYKLAKQQGYQTHYITTQKNAGALTHAFSMAHVDTWQDNDALSRFDGEYDNRLLLALQELNLDYQQKQFITLHMRSAHAPYVDNYPQEQTVFPTEGQPYAHYMRNSYDNSVRYTDKTISELIAHFKHSKQPTLIFMTSDHGELLGQDGRFGHNQIDLDVAAVPFLLYAVNDPEQQLKDIKNQFGCMTNHYEISRQIAKLLGAYIENPNQVAGQYYLNGQSPYGEAGFKRYTLDKHTCSTRLN